MIGKKFEKHFDAKADAKAEFKAEADERMFKSWIQLYERGC
jgi:hypothetical protein